ncbi:hypothetical protein C8F04DRAFT_1149115 [Mycena alexandri]|uniref:non-chaperonin molecular chaperone ATPase n=1 Tax=Mycena alexandri TaxID=1745969 RepID=A0AAD6S4W8_9AGAR|nr:hypothetical protein C8F04DRAFT_1149115 [Mycena alexandri]
MSSCVLLLPQDSHLGLTVRRLQQMSSSKAIGIDLGTVYSCVGVWKDNRVKIIANEDENRTTPSVVSFSSNGRLIGEAAKRHAIMNPANTVFNAKRLMGRRFDDSEVQADLKLLPFTVFNKGGVPYIRINDRGKPREFSPQEISAMILTKMKRTAENYLGTTINDAVITVPATFSDTRRRAIKDAGTIAGLNFLRLIDESTAAAVAYEFDSRVAGERNVLVLNIGGGTVDVSLLTLEEGTCDVRAVAGNEHLGGEDFNDILVAYFVAEFRRKHDINLSSNARALVRLRMACERAKRTLSTYTETTVEIDSIAEGLDLSLSLTRTRFEELCDHLFRRLLEPVERVLRDSKIDKNNVNEIVLVGGSSRIPRINKLISDFFNGKRTAANMDPDEAIAYGAAVNAAILSGDNPRPRRRQDPLPLDVTPHSLGIETPGGVMTALEDEALTASQQQKDASASIPRFSVANRRRLQEVIDENLKWFEAMRVEFTTRHAKLIAIADSVTQELRLEEDDLD